MKPTVNNVIACKRKLIALGLLPVVVGLGLGCKLYRGAGSDWINNWGPASVAYEWLFMLAAFFVFPRRRFLVRIAGGVFIGTCVVEFLQLWHPDWLQVLRATLPGRLVLGTTFSWGDFPAYLVGCVSGFFLLKGICHFTDRTEQGQQEHLRSNS